MDKITNEEIFMKTKRYYLRHFKEIYDKNTDWDKIVSDALSIERAREQMSLLLKISGLRPHDLSQKKLLEIGSGFALFVAMCRAEYLMDAYGIEPDEETAGIAKFILKQCSLNENTIVPGNGENLPYADETFDFVYSTNVLEHVSDPEKTLHEAVRVLKKGGILQFVVPNYNSFFEGHYGLLWCPFFTKKTAKAYVSLLRRNPSYIDTLQFITPQKVRNALKKIDTIEVLSWGKDIFEDRVRNLNFSEWAFLDKVKSLAKLIHKLKLTNLVIHAGRRFDWYTPIILTLRKK